MAQNQGGSERREYFRVKDWLIVECEPINALPTCEELQHSVTKDSNQINLLHQLSQIENENRGLVESLGSKDATAKTYLDNLNRKVELLTHAIVQSLGITEHQLTEVDISGGGIRFQSTEAIQAGSLSRLEMVLVPEYLGIVAIGRVVDCQPINEQQSYQIAIVFEQITASDRDAIVKHVFQVQSEQLRKASIES